MFNKLEQPLNAELPIFVTESGMMILDNPEQFSNAKFPMVIIVSGSSILVKPVQSLKNYLECPQSEMGFWQ